MAGLGPLVPAARERDPQLSSGCGRESLRPPRETVRRTQRIEMGCETFVEETRPFSLRRYKTLQSQEAMSPVPSLTFTKVFLAGCFTHKSSKRRPPF